MSASDKPPKLRLAPPEPAESAGMLGQRLGREKLAVDRQREVDLEHSLAPFRVGSVPYLNAAPLTRGLEEQIQFMVPSQLAVMLRNDELDAALVSTAEVLLTDRYDILDGIAIASLGEVFSVLLAHQVPLTQIKEVFCDTASISGVNLLKVLLAERGLKPEFKPLADLKSAIEHDAVLLIGDPAIDFQRLHHPKHAIWDLGAAWFELTNLPFVFAVWALRRGVENQALRRQLREAKDFGMDTLDHIINSRGEYDLDFRRDYLTWHVHFHLGNDERRGIARFCELLRQHALGPVFDPRYVN
jgi:chorismate dehydratase